MDMDSSAGRPADLDTAAVANEGGAWAGPLRLATAAVVALFLVPAVFVAVILPYHYWDSLAFGSWSRIIAESGSFSSSLVSDQHLHRPLFYVLQGYGWYLVGYHEWLGRLLSVVFAVLFVWATWYLARRLVPPGRARELLSFVTVTVIVSCALLAEGAVAGMSDVPVATASALTAAVLWSPLTFYARAPLVAAAAAATVFAKPTGLLALAGIALARLLFVWGRRLPRRELTLAVASVGAGAAVALFYDYWQSSRLDESLQTFLTAGNTGFYRERADAVRWDALLDSAWLGDGLRLPALYALAYAIARVCGAGARRSLTLGALLGISGSIVLPLIAHGDLPEPLATPGLALLAYVLFACAVALAPFGTADDPFDRTTYGALLLWFAPGAIAWAVVRPDEARFLSPVWPPATLLLAVTITVVALTLARRRRAVVALPLAALVLLAVVNVPNVDGLGRDGWRGLLELGPKKWGDKGQVENYAYGPFSYELIAARNQVREGETIFSSDGRLTYFFPRRVEVSYARSCSELEGRRLFALLTSGESADIMTRLNGSTADPLAWLQCKRPTLRMVGEHPGVHAVFVVGEPSGDVPPEACGIQSSPGSQKDAVLLADATYDGAVSAYEQALGAGFRGGLHIERTSCDRFRVVITGVPEDVPEDFRDELERSGFDATFPPAVRYPEVPADVAPARP